MLKEEITHTKSNISPVYLKLISSIKKELDLNILSPILIGAVRQLIPSKLVYASDNLSTLLLSCNFSNDYPELNESINNLITCFDSYINQYLKEAEFIVENNFYRPSFNYKKINPNPNYFLDKEKFDLWCEENFLLLCKFVNALNNFSSKVREYIDPYFMLIEGKFIINDELGTFNNGEPIKFEPKDENKINTYLQDVKIRIARLK